MNQSKKLLAALVAVPVSVVVADGAFAAEATLDFTIKNDFVNGGNTNAQNITKQDLNEDLANKIFEEMDKFNASNFSYNLDVTANTGDLSDLQYAKVEVQKLFDYLKVNLDKTTSITLSNNNTKELDNTLLYGFLNNVVVKATEVTVGNTKKVKLDLKFSYFTENSYKDTVDSIYGTSGIDSLAGINKVKKLHDYLISRTHFKPDANGLLGVTNPLLGSSSHAYSMWTYLLLKKGNVKVKYVYGLSGGARHSWNLVEIGGAWYNLDVSKDDNTISQSPFIQYKYFLTGNSIVGNREIYFGNIDNVSISENNIYANIVNPIKIGTKLYYVDGSDGKIKWIEEGSLNLPQVISDDKSELAKLFSYKNSLFFVNNSKGKQLYEYQVNASSTENPKLVVKTEVYSFKIIGTDLTIYKSATDMVGMKISLVNGIDKGMANYVASYIKGIELSTSTPATQPYTNKIVEAQRLVSMLTSAQLNEFNVILSEKDDPVETPRETVNKYLEKLEGVLTSTDSAVINVVNLIKAIDLEKSSYLNDVKDAQEELAKLTSDQRNLVYNLEILNKATNLVDTKTAVEYKIYQFMADNEKEENRKEDFYIKLEALIVEFESLHPNLIDPIFKAETFVALKNLGDSSAVNPTIKEIKDILQILNKEAANYLTKLKELKIKYTSLSDIQKRTLLTTTENNTIQSKLNELEGLEAVINKYVENKYISEVNDINNDSNNLNPVQLKTAFVNKVIKINELLAAGLLPSQWSEIIARESINPAPTFAQIQAKIDVFLARVKAIQDLVVGKAEEAEKLIEIFSANKYGTVQDFVTAVQKLESDLEALVKDSNGQVNEEHFNMLLTMLKPNPLEKFNKYQSIGETIESEIPTLENQIITLKADTNRTEVQVDALIRTIDDKDEIYKKFISNYNALEVMKKEFVVQKDKEDAAKFIIDTEYFLLKESPTYEEVKVLWDKYSSASDEFRKEAEKSASFTKLKALWEKLKAEEDAKKADEQKIKDLIEEIKSLTKESTKEEIEALKTKYDALTPDQKKLVTNAGELEKLLAALEEKEKDKQDALDKADADAVIKKIAELTDESTATEIAAVRAAYVALNENAKKLVSARTLELLTYYEARIEELIEIAQKEAAVVQDRINRITSSYTEAQIKNIRMAFNALSELAKTYITNLQKLINAENNIIYQNTVVKQAKLDANAFDVYMNDINRNSTTAEIAKARAYYNRLSGEAKKHVTTYEKLVRLETMWKDPEYLDLVFTYYPEYIHAVKPGAIVVQKPTYDPLYIPDDSATTPTYPSSSVATNPVASWSAYETMRYQNGRYTTTISSTQVKNIADRNMRLKADNIEIVIPTADLKASTATVGVSVNVSNDQLNIQFTEGNNAKYFSDYVEIHVPFSALKGNASQIIERVSAFGSAASFKVDGSTFIIRTKSSGTFRAATATTYNDIPSGEQGTAIRELAKRGIQFDTTSRLSQSYKQVTKMDVALMIATALDLSSNAKSKYLDLESDVHVKRAQGLLEAGIMSGATSARFNANGTITKQEAAIIIANMYRYLNQDLAKAYNNLNSNYGDIANLTLEARQSIAILELFGVVSGTGSFEPTEQLTRGEFAELLYKALTAIDYL